MPPKKKKGKGKGKKKKDDAQLDLEDKYKKTMDEIEALKDHLGFRKELARRNQSATETMKSKMNDSMKELESHKEDQKAINAAMTRQYKTMQSEMGQKTHLLERELIQTQELLRNTQRKLRETEEEKKRIIIEKDEEIFRLNSDISKMEREYKRILEEAMATLINQIDSSVMRWEEKAVAIQGSNTKSLLEFGLKPLDI